jgi:hypothetical protein
MTTKSNETIELAALKAGEALLSVPSPLTRLNYFDGKLLRADDLKVEQSYVRTLVALANQAGGAGVVHGYDVELGGGDSLGLGAGLAIDPLGRPLLLTESVTLPIEGLIEASERLVGESSKTKTQSSPAKAKDRFSDCVPATGQDPETRGPSDLYLVWLSHAEDFCGHEDVYGALCDASCATTVARRFIVEGVLVLVTPLTLSLPLLPAGTVAASARNLRSRVASAYFAQEAAQAGSLLSRAGLLGNVWCLGARLAQARGVPIAVLGRTGRTTSFLDAWTARRERMQAPSQSYWAGRMGLRPLAVFLAQVLQFQCQLPGIFRGGSDPRRDDPCAVERQVIGDAAKAVRAARDYLAMVAETLAGSNVSPELLRALKVDGLREQIAGYDALRERLSTAGTKGPATHRLLIEGGILETPSAGYLPVDPSANVSVNEQVTRLLGDGVDLRFCVVRSDYVPHALEEAQHMERISLIEGLADPARKPRVDVLVPDGEIVGVEQANQASLYAMRLTFGTSGSAGERATKTPSSSALVFDGAARAGTLPNGGGEFYLAGVGENTDEEPKNQVEKLDVELEQPKVEVQRVLKVAEAAREHSAARAAERTPGENRRTRLDGLPASAVAVEESSRVFAIWFEGRVTSDPFSLGLGEAAPLFGRFVLVNPQPKPNLSEFSLAGLLHFQNSSTTGQARVVTCIFKGQATQRFTRDGQSTTNSSPVDFVVRLVRSEVAGTEFLEVISEFPLVPGSQMRVQTRWNDGATLAQSIVTILSQASKGDERLGLLLKADSKVGEASDARHVLALRGLDVLEAVLDEATFRESAERALFPPVSLERRVQIRARRDWVLFHRRREKNCGPEERLNAPARRYRVFVTSIAADRLQGLWAALKSGATKRGFDFKELTTVEYAGGEDGLISSPSAILSALAQVSHGERLIASAVATSGAARADSNSLVFARLKRLETAVASVLSPAATLVSEVLAEVPEALLPSAGADGVALLVTDPVAAPSLEVAVVVSMGFKVYSTLGRFIPFEDDAPDGEKLGQFLTALAQENIEYYRLVLFTPDENSRSAPIRVQRVAEKTGRYLPTEVRLLTEAVRKTLPGEFADAREVIFFEGTRDG